MRLRWRCASPILLGLSLWLTAGAASAQPVEVPPTWGGDLGSRPRLTGSWFGLRDTLGQHGVVFDADLYSTLQGVASGGRDTGAEFWGNAEYTLNVDTGKAGLWPGGFLRILAQSSFGHSIDNDSGAIVPVNAAFLLPEANEPGTSLLNATFMQFLSPKFGVVAGKIFTLDGIPGLFAGNYRTQFMNTALVLPMNLVMVPISAYGGGIIVLPWEGVTFSVLALDPSGTPNSNDLTKAFDDGVLVMASGEVAITPFGLAGRQRAAFTWSDKERLSLEQDPSNLARLLLTERFPRLGNPGPILSKILERFFPELLVPVQAPKREDSTWAVYYGFDQYLWHPGGDQKRGIGLFFNFGASDGTANPVKYIFTMGIGGNGVVPGRPRDSFGLGWARTDFSGKFLTFLRERLALGLNHEDAIEMYYNASITPWLNATADLQIVKSALEKKLDSAGRLTDLDTAVIAGLRLWMRF